MAFAYSITLNDPAHLSQDALLTSNMTAAVNAWARTIGGMGSLEIEFNVLSLPTGVLAQGGPVVMTPIGTDAGRTLLQSGALSELQSGIDPNGSAADISIDVSSAMLSTGRLYLDLDPTDGSAVPARSYDGLTVLTHEMAHGLGVVGFRDSTGALPSDQVSTWDGLVTLQSDGTAAFTGSHAVAVYGGPVPVTTLQNGEQFYHLGNSAADTASSDLLGGTGVSAGQTRMISGLDMAILQDLGASIVSTPTTPRLDTHDDIAAVYKSVLQRSASLPEQDYWLAQEAAGRLPGQVRDSIVTSQEVVSFVNPIVRLYEAAFDRLPDPSGLSNHVSALHFNPIETIASHFVQSPEFALLHGGSSVTDTLIQSFYANALGRQGSSEEVAAWGMSGLDAAQILVGFSDSIEFQRRSELQIRAFVYGLSNVPPNSAVAIPLPYDTAAEAVGFVGHSTYAPHLGDLL
ncbi:DUF4214 domain-containing protein [Methylobacterium sp. E-016]|uniref:DUF4214 domain-containing protein n=1 Tax=Methylobacterium sp. E-016 TaxID=2836556 RepID=UPI001FBAA467|nr:DUF4214 domain-containing protein [Methylobacterium sp. E-016]MCJ2074452.1 DUF4214 domain-containing protein [Methylobacterium sp. E-016]